MPIPGESTATPIIWGDKVFVATAVQTDKTVQPDKTDAVAEGEGKEKEKGQPSGRFNITKPKNYFQFVVMCLDRKTGKTLWQKMAAKGGSNPPQFLSTHPAPGNRQATLEAMIPKMRALNPNGAKAPVHSVQIVK